MIKQFGLYVTQGVGWRYSWGYGASLYGVGARGVGGIQVNVTSLQ